MRRGRPDLFGSVRRSRRSGRQADTQASEEDAHDALVSLEAKSRAPISTSRSAQGAVRDHTNRNLATEARRVRTRTRQRRSAGWRPTIDAVKRGSTGCGKPSRCLPPARTDRFGPDINQLSQLLAREPGALQDEAADGEARSTHSGRGADGLPGDLVRRRPDIRAAEARLHAARARVGVAVAGLFPNVTFNANFGTQAERFPISSNGQAASTRNGPARSADIREGRPPCARTVHLARSQGEGKRRSTMRASYSMPCTEVETPLLPMRANRAGVPPWPRTLVQKSAKSVFADVWSPAER